MGTFGRFARFSSLCELVRAASVSTRRGGRWNRGNTPPSRYRGQPSRPMIDTSDSGRWLGSLRPRSSNILKKRFLPEVDSVIGYVGWIKG
jgi:hypothetical protein